MRRVSGGLCVESVEKCAKSQWRIVNRVSGEVCVESVEVCA